MAPSPTDHASAPVSFLAECAIPHTAISAGSINNPRELDATDQDSVSQPKAAGGECKQMEMLREKTRNAEIAQEKAISELAVDQEKSGVRSTRGNAAVVSTHTGGRSASSDEEDSLRNETKGREKLEGKSSDAVILASPSPAPSGIIDKFISKRKAYTSKRQAAAQVDAEAAAKLRTLEPISLLALFTYSTPFEKFINFVGLIFAAGAGAAQPLMTLIFGNLTTTLTNFAGAIANGGAKPGDSGLLQEFEAAKAELRRSAATYSEDLIWIGLAILVSTYIYMIIWQYTSEVTSKRIRERYLAATLRQDIAYFDNLGPGEVATRIQTDTHLVASGISEKVPLAVSYIATFVTGYVRKLPKEREVFSSTTALVG